MVASKEKVVLDTNILVSALMSRENACRRILNMAFDDLIQPIVSLPLFSEYEDVFARDHVFRRCPFDLEKRNLFLDDILSVCEMVEVHYLWRPNLRDEGDNFVYELGVAGNARIITQNDKDFRFQDLSFPGVEIIHPFEFLKQQRRSDEKWQH